MSSGIAHTIKQKGYTLIELLLYVVIVGVLLTTVTAFYGLALDARVKNQSISEVDQQGALAMELMTQTIRNASGITTPAAGASGNSLTITVPTGAFSPTIFNLTGTTLQIKEGAATAIPLTNSKVEVTSLIFRNLSRPSTPGLVQISMTLARVNPTDRNVYEYEKTFTTSAALRWP
jgi:prepilin-type N-terminal cleavage/methylation domain-containing protein